MNDVVPKTLFRDLDAPARIPWRGTRLPAVYQGERHCRRCTHGETVRVGPMIQDALFRHGGHGESQRIEADVCLACGHTVVASRQTVRPPRSQRRLG